MIKKIILDLDGPLLDGKNRHFQCYSDILIENGFTPLVSEEYWGMKRRRLNRHLQLAASQADGIYEQFLQSWLQRIEEKNYLALDRLQPGVLEKLQEWKSRDIELILVTLRNNQKNLREQLGSLGLLQLLDKVVAVGTEGGEAGKAEAARPYVERSQPTAVLWVGDTETDIYAARRLEVWVCAVACGLRTEEYLASLNPDFLVSDLSVLNVWEMIANEYP